MDTNPYSPGSKDNLDSFNQSSGSDGLGSLAQSARSKQLKSARVILFILGALQVAGNLYFVLNAESVINAEIEKEIQEVRRQPGMEVDQAAVKEAREVGVKATVLFGMIGVGVGVVFLVCGAMIYQYPVPITITSLILYLGIMGVMAYLDASQLARGFLLKIIIIVALVNAIKAALAYEQDRQRRPAGGFGSDTFSPPSSGF